MTGLRAYTILLYIAIVSSCCNEKVSPCEITEVDTPVVVDCQLSRDLDTIKMQIEGTWIWLQEERRQRGQPIQFLTPQSEGYSKTLILENGNATFYKCNTTDESYKFSILKWTEVSGTNYPEDQYPVLVYYNSSRSAISNAVPVMSCDKYLIIQYQYVSSIVGEQTWIRKN
jgi:hypothetical protein